MSRPLFGWHPDAIEAAASGRIWGTLNGTRKPPVIDWELNFGRGFPVESPHGWLLIFCQLTP